jgi:hypothetical protein
MYLESEACEATALPEATVYSRSNRPLLTSCPTILNAENTDALVHTCAQPCRQSLARFGTRCALMTNLHTSRKTTTTADTDPER